MYQYHAHILRVIDGDTVSAIVDLGFGTSMTITLRLAGIDAPELSTPEGKAAKQALIEMVEDQVVVVQTIKDRREKYGHYLAVLYPLVSTDTQSFNDRLLANGFAHVYGTA